MKRLFINRFLLYLTILIFLLSCREEAREDTRISIGITTSYLECAVRDLAGDRFDYVRIAPPGMCPGHFDLKPGLIRDLKKCPVILRFDFQESLDEKIRHWNKDSLNIYSIKAPEGLCVPDSYRICLKEVYRDLCKSFPGFIPLFDSNLEQSLMRLDSLEKECHKFIQEQGLHGAKVIASGHQEYFCRWLGMDVAASYSGGEATSPNQLKEILEKGKTSGIRLIVANRQEGRQQAEALSTHLGVPFVLFGNFPDMGGKQNSFGDLVRSNLDKLKNAAQKK